MFKWSLISAFWHSCHTANCMAWHMMVHLPEHLNEAALICLLIGKIAVRDNNIDQPHSWLMLLIKRVCLTILDVDQSAECSRYGSLTGRKLSHMIHSIAPAKDMHLR